MAFCNSQIVEDVSNVLFMPRVHQRAILVNGHDANNRLSNVCPARDKRTNLPNVSIREMPVRLTLSVLGFTSRAVGHNVGNWVQAGADKMLPIPNSVRRALVALRRARVGVVDKHKRLRFEAAHGDQWNAMFCAANLACNNDCALYLACSRAGVQDCDCYQADRCA